MGREGGEGQGKERCSFLKKRTKKLLLLWLGAAQRSEPGIKSFLLLFFKKEVFLPFCFRCRRRRKPKRRKGFPHMRRQIALQRQHASIRMRQAQRARVQVQRAGKPLHRAVLHTILCVAQDG